jgi:hypothetical protein
LRIHANQHVQATPSSSHARRHIDNVSVDRYLPNKSTDSLHDFRQRLENALADAGGFTSDTNAARHILHNLEAELAAELRSYDFVHKRWADAWPFLQQMLPEDRQPFRDRISALTQSRFSLSKPGIRGAVHRLFQRFRAVVATEHDPTAFVSTWDQLQVLVGARGGPSAIAHLWADAQEVLALNLPREILPMLHIKWPVSRKAQSFCDLDEFRTNALELATTLVPKSNTTYAVKTTIGEREAYIATGAENGVINPRAPNGPCWCQPNDTAKSQWHWYSTCKYLAHHAEFKANGLSAKATTLAAVKKKMNTTE